jgi:hypothetical protein
MRYKITADDLSRSVLVGSPAQQVLPVTDNRGGALEQPTGQSGNTALKKWESNLFAVDGEFRAAMFAGPLPNHSV